MGRYYFAKLIILIGDRKCHFSHWLFKVKTESPFHFYFSSNQYGNLLQFHFDPLLLKDFYRFPSGFIWCIISLVNQSICKLQEAEARAKRMLSWDVSNGVGVYAVINIQYDLLTIISSVCCCCSWCIDLSSQSIILVQFCNGIPFLAFIKSNQGENNDFLSSEQLKFNIIWAFSIFLKQFKVC